MISYAVIPLDRHAHLYGVTLRIERPAASQRLSLPVWIPGSYLVREFARHLSGIDAVQGGRSLAPRQLDKATWLVEGQAELPLVVTYRVYAFDTSVRAAFLDAQRGFFNGTSLCLRVEGQEDHPHRLALRDLPAGWQVATALTPREVDAAGCGEYEASGYDELVDHPVELGRFWRGHFEAAGVPHDYVVAGALPDFDGDRLLADAKRICETQIAFWHEGGPPPFKHYVFLHNLLEDGHGGLEHRASTALISPRRDMPQRGRPDTSDGYVNLLGLISHEYFHAWNVKRLRPAEFTNHDYTRENYTELLWFFEGFTSYYDDLLLLRTGLIDSSRYLRLTARALSNVLAAPGRTVQSVAQSSFDAWVKYYRTDENTPNSTVSYYAKGALVALALDLTLRAQGQGTLDDVMRNLWDGSRGGPIDEAAIAAALAQVGGRSFEPELAAWVHGKTDLPLRDLLEAAGVAWSEEPTTFAQRIGVRVSESALTGVKFSQVLRGGAAEQAGIAAGDELLAVDGWRVRRLDDALRLVAAGTASPWLVARDQRVSALSVTLPDLAPSGAAAVTLKPATAPAATALAIRQAWLGA
jgi:predicted metalloprotease with PDZ domain